MRVIEKIAIFLDPIIGVRQDDGCWTPNGNPRLQALKKPGHRSCVRCSNPDVALKILALNTEKALLKLDAAVNAVEKLKKKELAKASGGAPDEEP